MWPFWPQAGEIQGKLKVDTPRPDPFTAGKPVAARCHGPWTLVEVDVTS